MRRVTISLTDEEYSVLETQAQTQRRSVREMAGFLVTRPQSFPIIQPIPIGPVPFNPIWPPKIWCGTADATGKNSGIVWTNHHANDASGTQYSLLRTDDA